MAKKQSATKIIKKQPRDDTTTTIVMGTLVMCLSSLHSEMIIERVLFYAGAFLVLVGLILAYSYAKKDGKKTLSIFYLVAAIALIAIVGFLTYTLINPNW